MRSARAKRSALRALARRRKDTRWPGYKCIGDFHDGRYECDYVSPYTRSAHNVDADVMILLQDWASDKVLSAKISRRDLERAAREFAREDE